MIELFTFDLMMNPPSEHWFVLAAVLFILKIKPNHQRCFFYPLCEPGNEPLSASSWRDLDFCTSLSGGEPSKDGGAPARTCWKVETRNGFIGSSQVALSQHQQEKDDAPFIFPCIYPKWHSYRALRGELKQETRTPVFILRCFMFYWSSRRPDYRAEGTNAHTGDELKLIQFHLKCEQILKSISVKILESKFGWWIWWRFLKEGEISFVHLGQLMLTQRSYHYFM